MTMRTKKCNGQSMIRLARLWLNLNQREFGEWLQKKLGTKCAIRNSLISDWECYRKFPNKKVVKICVPMAANQITSDMIDMNYTEIEIKERIKAMFCE